MCYTLLLCFCRLDYCGIAILIVGSFVPWLYYTFYCHFLIMLAYLILILLLGTICIVVSMWDVFASPKFRPVRAGWLVTLMLLAKSTIIKSFLVTVQCFSGDEQHTILLI